TGVQTCALPISDEIVFYTFPKKKSSYPPDLVRIQYSAGDYIFKTSNEKSYQISNSSIPTNQLDSFEEYVNMHNKNTGKEVHIVSVYNKERFSNGENDNLYSPIINLNYDTTKISVILPLSKFICCLNNYLTSSPFNTFFITKN